MMIDAGGGSGVSCLVWGVGCGLYLTNAYFIVRCGSVSVRYTFSSFFLRDVFDSISQMKAH